MIVNFVTKIKNNAILKKNNPLYLYKSIIRGFIVVSNKIETKKQIIYANKPVVNTNIVSTTNTPLLSFNNTQNNWNLSIKHTTNPNPQYVQSYLNIKSKDGKRYNFNEVLEQILKGENMS